MDDFDGLRFSVIGDLNIDFHLTPEQAHTMKFRRVREEG